MNAVLVSLHAQPTRIVCYNCLLYNISPRKPRLFQLAHHVPRHALADPPPSPGSGPHRYQWRLPGRQLAPSRCCQVPPRKCVDASHLALMEGVFLVIWSDEAYICSFLPT